MIIDIDIDVFLPINCVYNDRVEEYVSSSINNLIDAKNGFRIPLDYIDLSLLFSAASDAEIKQINSDCILVTNLEKRKVIKASTTLKLDFEYLTNLMLKELPKSISNRESHPITKEMVVFYYIQSAYLKRFINFITFSQLAMPGSFWIDESPVYIDKKYFKKIKSFSSILVESISYNFEYPRIKRMNVENVWNWIIDKTHIIDAFSNKRIEKALNAFSYLFSENYQNDISTSLAWSLIGIEAIYAESNYGIAQQIDEKTQILLGSINGNKKILKKMYDFRSRFFHGELSTPINNGWIGQDEYDDKFYEVASFSAYMLTASLQKIIELDKVDLNFELVLK